MSSIMKPIFINHTNNITPKLLSDFQDEHINKDYLNIFDKICIGDSPVIKKKYKFDDVNKLDIKLETIVSEAYNLLTSNGFKIDKTNGMIEFCKYTLNGESVDVNLSLHKDDEKILPYKVETCIFYLEKTNGLIGGELLYQINTQVNKFLGLISYKSKETKLLNVCDRMVVLANGNLCHCTRPVSGIGTRKCIIVLFKSLDRN